MGLSHPPATAHSGRACPAKANPPGHLALVGPTASGKTALALALARRRPETVELVSVDSMAVYLGMDVGTAKPTLAERAGVAYHLVDLADPSEDFSVSRFRAAATEAIKGIEGRDKVALLVGGTGLYLQAVVDDLQLPGRWPEVAAALNAEIAGWQTAAATGGTGAPADAAAADAAAADAAAADAGAADAGAADAGAADAGVGAVAALHARLADLDPAAAARMEPTNRRRVVRALEVTLGSGRPFSSFGPGLGAYPPSRFALVGLSVPGPVLAQRIDSRLDAQLAAGFVDEVRRMAARPAGLSRTARQAVGYRELLAHVETGLPLAQAVDETRQRARRLARRQRAWFGRDPRITWLAADDPAVALDELETHLDTVLAGR